MKKDIHLIFLIFLFVTIACNNSTSVENSQLKKNTTQNVSATTPAVIKEVKPLIDFFKIVNKSPNEIEKTYGKPILVEKKSVQFKDGEFRHYKVFKDIESKLEDLQIDYYQGKAVSIYLNIPQKYQSKEIEETIKLCGFQLDAKNAQIGETGTDYWWKKQSKLIPFDNIHIKKYNDSGLFYKCEASIKIQ
jgi:hypothetical protein